MSWHMSLVWVRSEEEWVVKMSGSGGSACNSASRCFNRPLLDEIQWPGMPSRRFLPDMKKLELSKGPEFGRCQQEQSNRLVTSANCIYPGSKCFCDSELVA